MLRSSSLTSDRTDVGRVPRKNMYPFRKTATAGMCFPTTRLLIAALLASVASASAQVRTIDATIDTSKTSVPISKYIYGQFLEHGGDIVNTGVWSEMLVDRKFYYPVATSAPTPPPVLGNAAGNPRMRRVPTRWWTPIGGDDAVTMDTKSPFTGDQSPLVKLDAKEPHGFSQSGIAARKGRAYTGRIVLASSRGAVVKSRSSGARKPRTVRPLRLFRSVPRIANSRCATRLQPIPMMPLSKSPARAPAPSMSARFL